MALLNSREREAIEQSWLLTSMPTSQLSDEILDEGAIYGPSARGRGRSPPRERPISPEERRAAAARRSMSPTMRKAQHLASRDHVLHVLMARRAATARLRQFSVGQASQAPDTDVQPSSEWDVPHWMAASAAMADKVAATMSTGRRSLADLAAMASMLRQSQVRSSSPWLRTLQSELGEAEVEQQEQQEQQLSGTWGASEQVQGDGGQDSPGGAIGRPSRKLQQMMSRRSPGRVRVQGLGPGGGLPQKRRPGAAQSVAQYCAQHAVVGPVWLSRRNLLGSGAACLLPHGICLLPHGMLCTVVQQVRALGVCQQPPLQCAACSGLALV